MCVTALTCCVHFNDCRIWLNSINSSLKILIIKMKVVIPSLTSSKHPRFVVVSLRKQPSLLAAEMFPAARSEERRLFSHLGSNTEQDTEEVKSVCAPFHLSTKGCEGKETSDPPSQPTSKSRLILTFLLFATCFSFSFCDMVYAE